MEKILMMLKLEKEAVQAKMSGAEKTDLRDGELYAQLQLLARLEQGLMKVVGYV